MPETRPLTEAEIAHLTRYNATLLEAKRRLDEFMAFLRDQHDAPASEWVLRRADVGFERVGSTAGNDSD